MDVTQPVHKLTRQDLERLPARRVRLGPSYKADLFVYRVGGEDVFVKDYGGKRGIWRSVLGPFFVAREARALRALTGVPGVPQLRCRPDRYCVAMAYIPGRSVRKTDPALQGNEAFVRDLARIVRDLHARGVVHLDLKHRSNLMVGADELPVVLDFESAVVLDPRWPGSRLIVNALGRLDWLAVHNWTRRLCPHMLAGSRSDVRKAPLARRLRGRWLPRRVIDAFLNILTRRGQG